MTILHFLLAVASIVASLVAGVMALPQPVRASPTGSQALLILMWLIGLTSVAVVLFAVFLLGWKASTRWGWWVCFVVLAVPGLLGPAMTLNGYDPSVLPVLVQGDFCLVYAVLLVWKRTDGSKMARAPGSK